jgi:hypothetical protein
MSVIELRALARKHWKKHRPKMVREMTADGSLEEEIVGAANLAQSEIESLMRQGYQESEAREVALAKHVLLPEEDDEPDQELADKEAAYQKMRRREIEIEEADL